MVNMTAFIAVLIIILIIAGKYAGKTVMNAVRIGTLILALISLIKNWNITSEALVCFFNKAIPFVYNKVSQFLLWVISSSHEISDKALKKLLR
ncbi:hypothetical protein LY28_02993 [Ruminiclostridium sufflavum DSM 19573]|uniref:Uncharacterized protein n=1 Tax=Ruminiclostridium sufflavum DSM 19573 TaxID=1121337 RepID=A0A318XHB1_9FIRM|nr:hypothetical protein [Ruminiclostridium sufflavum]PYG86565.1 hypothetical protein LY28_02993 [Ruminiclostridium sufflavum DSM 19573]